jgi:hypothetical protein
MPKPVGKLKEVKPGVWINPDAVAMATCVADGTWMMPKETGGKNRNGERQYMLALTLWDGSCIVCTDMTDIVRASSILKLPHPTTWKLPSRPAAGKSPSISGFSAWAKQADAGLESGPDPPLTDISTRARGNRIQSLNGRGADAPDCSVDSPVSPLKGGLR